MGRTAGFQGHLLTILLMSKHTELAIAEEILKYF